MTNWTDDNQDRGGTAEADPVQDGSPSLLTELIRELKLVNSTDENMSRVNDLVQTLAAKSSIEELPEMLLTVYAEITAALGGIRLTRDTIQANAVDRLRDTHARLDRVTSETESAANSILDGLDNAIGLIDKISEANNNGGSPEERRDTVQASVDALRLEVMGLFGHLQFQDITVQQLRGAIGLLSDVEARLDALAAVIDPACLKQVEFDSEDAAADHNAEASMSDAADRQALADETVKRALSVQSSSR